MTTHNPRLLGILIDFLNANVFNIEYLKPVLSSGAEHRCQKKIGPTTKEHSISCLLLHDLFL